MWGVFIMREGQRRRIALSGSLGLMLQFADAHRRSRGPCAVVSV